MTKELIIFLQRILNPNDIEKWARDNNIQLPIGQIIGQYLRHILNAVIPLSGAMVSYIGNSIETFYKKDPDLIMAEMNSSSGASFAPTSDLNFNLFGQNFTIAGANNNLYTYLAMAGLVMFLGYEFLKS